MRRLIAIILAVFFLIPTSAPVNATTLSCAEGGICVVGDTGPGGGIVFFVKSIGSFEVSFIVGEGEDSRTYTAALTSGQQAALPFDYLEFAPTGRSEGSWGTNGAITNNTSLLIGSGEANTNDILLTQTGVAVDNAARYAQDYVNNGRTDWFLPSYHELLLMMLRVKLGTFPTDYFPIALWSSSTGGDATTAYTSALNQLQGQVNRLSQNEGVRPIRAFSIGSVAAPGAPTIGTATALSVTSASISFTAPANDGGATIETYTATSTPGLFTGQLLQAGSGSITVTGLTSSTAYTFTVTASNSAGTSTASSASVSITMPASDAELAEQAAQAAAARDAAARAASAAAAVRREAEKKSARSEILDKFRSSEKVTIETFAQAEIAGITKENIEAASAEILALPEESRSDILQVLKIARKYEVVGKIASERVSTVQSGELIAVGLISAESKHKATLTAALRKLPAPLRSSYAQIEVALNALMETLQARKDRLAAVIARNAARNAA